MNLYFVIRVQNPVISYPNSETLGKRVVVVWLKTIQKNPERTDHRSQDTDKTNHKNKMTTSILIRLLSLSILKRNARQRNRRYLISVIFELLTGVCKKSRQETGN